MWQRLVADTRTALRFLRRSPGFALTAALSITIGVGANTLVFAWLDSLILNPLPTVPEYSRLVAVNGADADGTTGGAPRMNYPDFLEWRRRVRSFDGIAAHSAARLNLRIDGVEHAQSVWGLLVAGDYFELLRTRPAMGRTLTAADDEETAPVVVVSDAFWRMHLGARTDAIGRELLLNRAGVTVVGVMPAGFRGHETGYAFDIWVPASLLGRLGQGSDLRRNRSARWLAGIARLKPGVTVRQANEELMRVGRDVSAANGDRPVTVAAAIPMREWRGASVLLPILLTLQAVSVIILLLSCTSVATLVLVRTLARASELGVRLALGAGRWNVVRLVLVEVAVIAAIGGALGLAAAFAGKPAIVLLVPPTPGPVELSIRLSPRVGLVAFGVTVTCVLLAGLVPALRTGSNDLVSVLRRGGRGAIGGRRSLQHGLVVAQLTMAVVGLMAAAIFLRSLNGARTVDVGFHDPDHVLLYNLDFAAAGLSEAEAVAALERITSRVAGSPGIIGASASTMVPLGFGGHRFGKVEVAGYVAAPDESMSIELVSVAGDYFATMKIGLLEGRSITQDDRAETLPVAVVNSAFVRRFFPAGNAIGQTLDLGTGPVTIVGIARDGRYNDLREVAKPIVFRPWSQQYRTAVALHVRTVAAPRTMARAIASVVTGVNSALVPTDLRTLSEHMSASTFVQRLGAVALGLLGTLALAIAGVGLFGVMSFAVSQRLREVGIRLALGATPWQVRAMYVRQSTVLALIATLAGALATAVLAKLASDQLVGTDPRQPTPYVAVGIFVVAIGATAGFLPSRRAARVDAAAVLTRD